MERLATLAGKRGCCKRGVCIHRQAKIAVDRIEKLKANAQKLFARLIASWQARRRQEAEIEQLREIIGGALVHSYGPYSDKELLRRVVGVLQTVTEGKETEAAEAKEK